MPKQQDRIKAGRPRMRHLTLPSYDSMGQMSSDTGIPLEVLRYAKKQGSKFSRDSKCYLDEFLRWFFSRGDDKDEDADWGVRDKKATALIKEVRLERLRGTVVDFALADNFIRELVARHFFGELHRLRNEFPGGLKGKNEVEVAKEVERQMELIEKKFKRRLDEWVTVAKKQGDEE